MQGPFENENVTEFIYLGMMLMNQYCRREQTESRIHMGVHATTWFRIFSSHWYLSI